HPLRAGTLVRPTGAATLSCHCRQSTLCRPRRQPSGCTGTAARAAAGAGGRQQRPGRAGLHHPARDGSPRARWQPAAGSRLRSGRRRGRAACTGGVPGHRHAHRPGRSRTGNAGSARLKPDPPAALIVASVYGYREHWRITMPALMHIAESLPEEERNMRIHAGDILVFRGPPRMSELLELLRSHCCRFLGSDPEQIHSREPAAAIEARLEHLRAELRRDERIGWAWHAVIEALGADTGNTYGDGVVVRGQPPQNAAGGVRTAPLSAHRDTWGSNIAAQTNWW